MFALEGSGIPDEREGAADGEGVMKGVIRLHFAERGFVAGGQTGEFIPGAMADSEDDDARGEPARVPPLGVGFGVEAEVHPKIDVGNDGAADLAVPRLGGANLF